MMSSRLLSKLIFVSGLMGSIYADSGLPNAPFRPEAQKRTIDVFAEALYWYTSETVDWGFTVESSGNSVQTSYKSFVFDWAPGFSVGLGYNMDYDQWDTQASYTWFQSRAEDSTSGPVTTAFLPARLSLLEPFSTGRASLNVDYNMFDLDLGRRFLVSRHLVLRPAIGVRGGWITQTLDSNWTTPHFLDLFLFTASENVTQHFHGVGPTGGISAKFCFGDVQENSFSLIGEFDASYLWGWWSIQDKFVDNLETVIYLNTSERHFGALMLHSFLGFGWDRNFSCDRFHLELKLGYEIEDWLNQFQIFSDISGSQNNDLILQGLNFGLRLDF